MGWPVKALSKDLKEVGEGGSHDVLGLQSRQRA